MSETEPKASGDNRQPSSSGQPGDDSSLSDPWACYEDGAEFCGSEAGAESCCCCCC